MKKFLGTGKLFLVLALCFALCGALLILPINAFAGEISNGILTLTVQDDPQDTAYAAFMLKKANEESTLTYAQFFSSYTTISVNGVSYRFGEGEVVTPAYATENNEVIAVQSFGGVQVTQTLKLTTGNSSKEDMLQIAYSAENQTDADVLLSVRIVIDPTLAKSETDMIQVNGVPCNTEKTFTGAEVANDWCIKDASGEIVAYGILNTDTGKPDRMQVANWDKLYDHKIGYQTTADAVIEDNAVALVWENKQLSADASMDFSTKYGLYSEDPAEEPTEEPTEAPTEEPTEVPTEAPTEEPTEVPTEAPTEEPTETPTEAPDVEDVPDTNVPDVENNPQTNDYLHTMLPVILFVLSGLCLAAFAAINWKRRGN